MADKKSTDQSFAHQDIYKVLDREEVRKVLAYPRKAPRKVREEIAKIIVEELRSGFIVKDIRKFTGRFGAFYPIFNYLKHMEQWKELKAMTEMNEVGHALILIHLLPLIYELIEKLQRAYKTDMEIDGKVEEILERFAKMIERTMDIWGGAFPDPDSLEWKEMDKNMEVLLSEDEQGIIDELIREYLQAVMDGLLDNMKDNLEILETLLLLFPGRFWDYSRMDLHNTFLGDLQNYASLMERNSELKDMLDILGRIDIEYQTKRPDLSALGTSEVYSTHTSSDIKHLLPMELVKLKDPVLKNLFLAQLVEGKLLTYQLRGKNWDGRNTHQDRKGPVIALVDTSGSMAGGPEITAKAIVLSVARKLMKEDRDLKVILFSSIDQTVEIELTDKKRMGSEFLSFLQLRFGGGTDFNTALREGVRSLKDGEWKDADLLFLTDGHSILSDEKLLEEWQDLKAEHGVRAFTIIIGNTTSGGLAPISDMTYILKKAREWDMRNSPGRMLKLL